LDTRRAPPVSIIDTMRSAILRRPSTLFGLSALTIASASPRWLITFDAPVVAHGLAGLRKEIRGIALLPDDDAPISALQHAIAARDTRAEHR
jgi:hypothetical protein